MSTDPDDIRPIQAMTALLDGPLSVADLSAVVSSPMLGGMTTLHRGERLLLLSTLQRSGQLDQRIFAALRSRHPRRRQDIDAAEVALEGGALLPLVNLLATMYGLKDLRGFLRQVLGPTTVSAPASRSTSRAAGAALQMHREARLQPALFDHLLARHPDQADAIRDAAAYSLPLDRQFGYLFGGEPAAQAQPTHVLRVASRRDHGGQAWIGAELRTPEGTVVGWSQWRDGTTPSLQLARNLPAGTLLRIQIPDPALATVDWELIDVAGEPLGARLVTCRGLGTPLPPVALSRYNLVEVTGGTEADRFARCHDALGRVRMAPRPAFTDLSAVRRALEGSEPVDVVHVNAYDDGSGRMALSPGGDTLGPGDITPPAQGLRYRMRRMIYLNLCGTSDTVAWVDRLRTLGFQAIVATTDPIAPDDADAAAAAFYDAASRRKTTLAQALQEAQRAVPGASGKLALYADPTSRLRS